MGPLAEAADQTSSELIVISTSWENMMKTFVSDGWNERLTESQIELKQNYTIFFYSFKLGYKNLNSLQ